MPPEIRQRPALTDEVVDQHIAGAFQHGSAEPGLTRKPIEASGSRMCNDVGLNDPVIDRPTEPFGQDIRQCFWNGIDTRCLKGMRTEEYWLRTCDQPKQRLDPLIVKCVKHEPAGSIGIAGFRCLVVNMLFYKGLRSMKEHIRKGLPRHSGWEHAGTEAEEWVVTRPACRRQSPASYKYLELKQTCL